MSTERVGNLGYCAFSTETTPGKPAAIPSVYTLLENETLSTNYNLEDQMPVAGNAFETFQVLPGLRDHKGDIEIVGEPNTATELVDCLLTRGSKTGADPYTWPFTLDPNTKPKSKTVDISLGNVVKRFVGVQASKLVPVISKNQINLKASLSALGSFQGAALSGAPTGVGPYTVVFDTTYDTNPTDKLFVGDLIRFFKASDGSHIDATVASIVDVKTITTVTDVTTMGTGDFMHLRPATPSFTLLTPFLWSQTQFCFGASAAAALSAAQTRLEQGSTWEIDYGFESDSGSQRSGSADPASLVRLLGKSGFTAKKFFDTPEDVIAFNQQTKNAVVIRHFAYSGGKTYELRVTINHLVTDDPVPKVKSRSVNYSEIKYKYQYSQSDGQAFDIKVLSGLTAIT